jgi:nucleotide-binding universal stress UspA family protein
MADTILVPFELPDPEPLSPVLVRDLAPLDVVAMGHFQVPEQTPRDVAREQFEAEAQAALEAVTKPFRDRGQSVRTRLVFGRGREAAINTVMLEEDCAAELDPAPTEGIKRILVPIPAVEAFARLPEFIRILCEETTVEVTLFHVAEGEESIEEAEAIVTETRKRLIDAGLEAELVDTLTVAGESHDAEILRVAADYDAVVMYAPEAGIRDRVFGSLPDRIANQTGDPVIVVRRDYDAAEVDGVA